LTRKENKINCELRGKRHQRKRRGVFDPIYRKEIRVMLGLKKGGKKKERGERRFRALKLQGARGEIAPRSVVKFRNM